MTLEEIRSKALEMAEPEFKKFEPIALANTKKVLEAFKECQVSDYHLQVLRVMVITMWAVRS